jgi:hypothetical protein
VSALYLRKVFGPVIPIDVVDVDGVAVELRLPDDKGTQKIERADHWRREDTVQQYRDDETAQSRRHFHHGTPSAVPPSGSSTLFKAPI